MGATDVVVALGDSRDVCGDDSEIRRNVEVNVGLTQLIRFRTPNRSRLKRYGSVYKDDYL
jgi:hypothetical protein